ncbi:hypothetical protein [Candidatus Entotheonella palauensis]|uniref:hypothetical protein n=1 Tax=Candidatus Entotheonella palauensis TaxID=93172 RepID=UPI001177A7E9|nr:hypothetical protein [Candidatus Entotheonella palauensis]
MVSHPFFYQLVLFARIWLVVILHLTGSKSVGTSQSAPAKPRRRRASEPTSFAGLTHTPHCALCEQETTETTSSPPRRPDPMPATNRRPRTVDTTMHFCPHLGCDDRGGLGLNNLRAHGHRNGGLWRQFHCTSCEGYFPEHHGTMCHGK